MKIRTLSAAGYPIHIGKDVFRELNRMLNYSELKRSAIFVLVDENSLKHCYPVLLRQVKRLKEAELIEVESGEENKNIDVCTNIWSALSSLGADRHSVLINLGGGVIGDMGGFAAATFKRGITFVNIPTTLLAQVDASVGGKLGIDLDNLKNEVGLFTDPAAVFIYPEFLSTLSQRQMLSGFAEIVKHALIADRKYWQEIRDASPDESLEAFIIRSVEIKNSIVKKDPKEKGLRKVLNFGHTIGHAIESWSLEGGGVQLLHGEAVAIGMVCEAWLSAKRCGLHKSLLNEITSYILRTFKTVRLDKFDDLRLIELMKHDKKNNSRDKINFTLLSEIGSAETDRICSVEEIKGSLRYYREQANLIG
jgi:3-dehydroquinate synthase